ncbi:MAG: transposase, partial [Thaumarchaeota archaeon]|nr:transposase [Nitrososphaerota archaeon]
KEELERIHYVVTCPIHLTRELLKEYNEFKKVLTKEAAEKVRKIIKRKDIRIFAQQKWQVSQKIERYLKRLPYHPMPFHRQSCWLEKKAVKTRKKEEEIYILHIKTKEGDTSNEIFVPYKWRSLIDQALGENNDNLGQVEIVERQDGTARAHITLRFPKPQPYEPKSWLGVDTGWNKLAVSIIYKNGSWVSPSVHNRNHKVNYKEKIKYLRYLYKKYQRTNKAEKWNNRLQNTIKYVVGCVAKEIVSKAKKHEAGVAMENLNFQSVTKGFLIPRYKLMVAVKTLCEREGVPFVLVPAKNTSITCPKCGYISKRSRNGERFKCVACSYEADADIVGAMNIAKKASGSS